LCPLQQEREIFDAHFVFAVIWAFGGSIVADKKDTSKTNTPVSPCGLLVARMLCTSLSAGCDAFAPCSPLVSLVRLSRLFDRYQSTRKIVLTPRFPCLFVCVLFTQREAFSDWWKATHTAVKFPKEGTVFDYFPHPKTGKMVPWQSIVPAYEPGE
jgi:hypothetical protein